MKRKILIPALIMAGIATAGGLAYAQQSVPKQNDAIVELAKAKISLAQAIAIAEQQVVGGKATHAELENENGRIVYGVEVTDGTNATDVKVDATDGRVVSAQPDAADNESENGGEEADDN